MRRGWNQSVPSLPGPGALRAIWSTGCDVLTDGTLSSDEGGAFSPQSSQASYYFWDQVLVACKIPLHICYTPPPQEIFAVILAQTETDSPAGWSTSTLPGAAFTVVLGQEINRVEEAQKSTGERWIIQSVRLAQLKSNLESSLNLPLHTKMNHWWIRVKYKNSNWKVLI